MVYKTKLITSQSTETYFDQILNNMEADGWEFINGVAYRGDMNVDRICLIFHKTT